MSEFKWRIGRQPRRPFDIHKGDDPEPIVRRIQGLDNAQRVADGLSRSNGTDYAVRDAESGEEVYRTVQPGAETKDPHP